MPWRKWIVRGIVYGITSAAAIGALLYQRWTNPAAVREQIIAKLSESFPGAHVSVDSARILGGIQLNGLRLLRNDDPEKHEFLHVPSAIFYHDKEKILDGELKLRKIELIRPRLRVRRERDGSWNWKNILRAPEDKRLLQLASIVIHQGTVILEDRSDPAKPSSIEIDDISLTIINDPLPLVTIRGAANSDLLGKLQVTGRLQRTDGEASLSFKAVNIPLTHVLASRFPLFVPSHVAAGLQMTALANVRGQVSYHPKQSQPIFYDVHCDIRDGCVQHPQLPLPLDELNAKLHATNGELHLEKLTARSGNTDIEARGIGLLAGLEKNFEVDLDLKHVMLGDELASRLPDKIRELHKMFQPKGPTTIHIACAREDGEWTRLSSLEPSMVSLRPEEIEMEFVGFKYPLTRAEGTVDYNILEKQVDVKLIAFSGERPINIHGSWKGTGNEADVDFDFVGRDLPIDDKLIKALPGGLKNFAESFHATGRVDVKTHIRHERGAKSFENRYEIGFRDVAIRWDNFPYPLTDISGLLQIHPDQWKFREFRGRHGNSEVHVDGASIPKGREQDAHGISMEIRSDNLVLNDELHNALRPMPGLQKAWETFNPKGPISFRATIKRPNADMHDLDVQVETRGAAVKPAFFPYTIADVGGKFHFNHNRLTITNLRARHDDTMLMLDKGTVDLHPRGGYYADFPELQIQGIRLDDDFVSAMPDKLRAGTRTLRLNDPLRVKSRVVIAQAPETGKPPDIFWDAQLWLTKAKFTTGLEFSDVTGTLACVGRHNGRQFVGLNGNLMLDEATLYGQPFKNVHSKFQMREHAPDVLLMGLRAPVFGGDVTGQVRVNFNSSLDYEMNLTASQINIAEFGRHNLGPRSQLSGIASARLHLKGLSTGLDSLDGNGSLEVPRGHFLNLPLVLDMLKLLGLSGPDRTVFEEFRTDFAIQGSQVNFQKVDLLGSAVSLSGKGEYDLLSKKVKLDIYPMWGRVEQLLPTSVRPVPTAVSKNLLTVEVRGKIGTDTRDLKYNLKPVPIVLDPLLLLRDRMMGQPNGLANEPAPVIPTFPSVQVSRPRWMRLWD